MAEYDKSSRSYYQKRVAAATKERTEFIGHYRELSDFIEPRRGRFLISDRNRGNRRHGNIINSSALQAHRIAQSGLFAGVMSPTRPWFKLETLDTDMMKSDNVKNWLFDVEQLLRSIFLESNFYNQAPVMLGELVLFGTSAMSQVNDFENVARFYTHTAGSYMICQNNRYEVDTFILEQEWTVQQIVQEFGTGKVSKAVKDAWDRGEYLKWYPITQIIEPNPSFDPTSKKSTDKRYRSVWFEPATTNNQGTENGFLRKSGFDEFPVHVVRWATTGSDIYGTNSPGMIALGDTKSLLTLEKRKAQGIDKMVNPPLKGPPSVRDVPINALPGGVSIADVDGQKESLTTLYQVEPRVNELRIEIDAIERRIREAFFVDLFLAISTMEGIQPKNQLELSQRNEERLLMLGPPLQRIQLELLDGTINRTFQQALRANILPPPPPELQGQTLSVRYIGSLAMAQRAVETANIERIALFAGQMAQIDPNIVDKLDADEALDQYARMIGVVPTIVRSTEAVQAIRQQRAEQQKAALDAQIQQQQSQAAQSQSAAVRNVAEADNVGKGK